MNEAIPPWQNPAVVCVHNGGGKYIGRFGKPGEIRGRKATGLRPA